MSMFAAYLRTGEAHVLSDTAAYDAGGRLRYFTSKALPLPHINAVISGRGADEPFELWTSTILRTPLPHGLDSLIAVSPDMLQRIYSEYEEQWSPLYELAGRTMKNTDDIAANEIAAMVEVFAVGWSASRGKMVGAAFSNMSGDKQFGAQIFESPNLMMAPPVNETMRKPRVPADLIKLGRAMFHQLAGEAESRGFSEPLCGGDLLWSRITRRGIESRILTALPGRDDQLAKLEAY